MASTNPNVATPAALVELKHFKAWKAEPVLEDHSKGGDHRLRFATHLASWQSVPDPTKASKTG